MKKLVFLVCLVGIVVSANAQGTNEITLKTDVSEATVFIKGAQVLRKTTANIPAGRSILHFVNLSPYADAQSVQVKLDADVTVLSVNYQLNYNDTVQPSSELEKLRIENEALQQKIVRTKTDKEIVNGQMAFLADNKQIGGSNTGVNLANLQATYNYYATQLSQLKTKELELDNLLKKLNEEKVTLDRKIANFGSVKAEPTGEMLLSVEAKSPIRAPVELTYYTTAAGWYPSYDIRAKSIDKPIELSYKANISQNTKEVWKNIKLKVSSAEPNVGNVAPKLKTYKLNYWTKPPRYDVDNNFSNTISGVVYDDHSDPLIGAAVKIKGSTIGTVTDIDGRYSLSIPANGGELEVSYIGFITQNVNINSSNINIVLQPNNQQLDEVVVVGYGTNSLKGTLTGALSGIKMGGVSSIKQEEKQSTPPPVAQIENTTSIEFEIRTPYTILSENKNTVVEMERYEIPAEYEYFCIPKIKKDAFLLAHITDWEQYNLLEGEANIFFENTFVGKTILDVRYMKDTLDVSLGRDRSIIVQREKSKDFNKSRFLSSKIEVTRNWKISVRNNKSKPVSMILLDQIPVSTMSEIEVSPEKLDGGELNKDSGAVTWKFSLKPAEKKELELKYKVKYPKDRNLIVE
ncbi:membrane protein [Bacteroidia bacterium]|nr:membrane protein [Bacteroidia bacterium]